MAHLTRFCIDHHSEIFEIPASICAKLAQGGVEPEKNKENTMTPVRGHRQIEESVVPPKHKKIAELIDGDTPRKKTKVESPKKSPATTTTTAATKNSPSKSPRRLRNRGQRAISPFFLLKHFLNYFCFLFFSIPEGDQSVPPPVVFGV